MRFLLIFVLIFFADQVYAQFDSVKIKPVYSLNHKIEIPGTIAGLGLGVYYIGLMSDRAVLSGQEVMGLSRSDVNFFDRSVIDFSEKKYENARTISDYVMNATILSPLLLLFDKDIRRDWLDYVTLFGEVHLSTTWLYVGSASLVGRARPLAYNVNLPVEKRSGRNTNNSFFSGHTSSTAVSSFFMAKVYSDYHDLDRWQKALLYFMASVPPSVVGYYRIRGGKHFRTDVLTGFTVGAASGILIPEFRKINRKHSFSLVPVYSPEFKGLTCSIRFN